MKNSNIFLIYGDILEKDTIGFLLKEKEIDNDFRINKLIESVILFSMGIDIYTHTGLLHNIVENTITKVIRKDYTLQYTNLIKPFTAPNSLITNLTIDSMFNIMLLTKWGIVSDDMSGVKERVLGIIKS